MGLSCNMCNPVLDNFSLLLSHFKRVHRRDPNFFVLYGINGCGKTYNTFYGYRSHLNRTHKELLQIAREVKQPQDFVQDVEIEEPDGDVLGEEPLSDEDDHPPGEQLRCTSAAYLLRIKETHNLSQKALDDIVQGTNTQVFAAVKSICVNNANQFQNNAEEDDDEEEDGLQNITWQTLFEQNSEEVENSHQRRDGMIADYCDGQVFQQHPLFSRDPCALQIILYYDEVEVVNPLGSKTSKYKVGVFYYTLGNINPKHRSQLKAMQLLAIAKRPVIKKYGCNEILRTFMTQLAQLEQNGGYQFIINGERKSFTGTIAFVSGDNLASQEIGGFKIGSSSALKCRVCMGNANDVATKFGEDDFQLCTRAMYDQHCTAIETSDDDISSQYGINLRSILNQSRYFHVTEGLPGDAMHVLEGLLQYEVKELLKYVIIEQQFFTLDNLN